MRRSIVVPKIDNFSAIKNIGNDPQEFYELKLSDQDFERLWKIKFFKRINKACDIIIDDYEGEDVQPEKFDQFEKVINTFIEKYPDDKILTEIMIIFLYAKSVNRPIYFNF